MTRQEILKLFLEDPFFKDKPEFEFLFNENFNWTTPVDNNLIIILKKVIENVMIEQNPNQAMSNFINNLNWRDR